MKLRGLLTMGLAVVFFGVIAAACSGKQSEGFPSFGYGTALSLESYRAAASLPREVETKMPCYCGCEGDPTRHMSLWDCFYNQDGSYSDHAAGCDLCGKIVLDVKSEYDKGKSLKEIRAMIDSKYSVYGKPTNTPPVEE